MRLRRRLLFKQVDATLNASIALAEADKRIADLHERVANLLGMMERVKDPGPMLLRYNALTEELEAAKAGKEAAGRALLRARGEVSPFEHLMRVRDVRGLMQSDDKSECADARMKVHEALKAIVQRVRCNPDDGGQRTLMLVVSGGAVAFKFDNQGRQLAASTMMANRVAQGDQTYRLPDGTEVVDTVERVITGLVGEGARQREAVEAVARRIGEAE